MFKQVLVFEIYFNFFCCYLSCVVFDGFDDVFLIGISFVDCCFYEIGFDNFFGNYVCIKIVFCILYLGFDQFCCVFFVFGNFFS